MGACVVLFSHQTHLTYLLKLQYVHNCEQYGHYTVMKQYKLIMTKLYKKERTKTPGAASTPTRSRGRKWSQRAHGDGGAASIHGTGTTSD